MAPGPIIEAPKSTDIVVAPRTEIEFVPKMDFDITLPGLDGFQLGGNPVVEGLDGQGFSVGTLKLFGDTPASGTAITPTSSPLPTGGILAGLSVFLGGCSFTDSILVGIIPGAVVLVGVAAYFLGRLFRSEPSGADSNQAPPMARQERVSHPAEIEVAEEELSPEEAELRNDPNWAWSWGILQNPQYGRAHLEEGLLFKVAEGGSLTSVLKSSSLKTTMDSVSNQSDDLAKDVKEFSDQKDKVVGLYEDWEKSLVEYGKISADDPEKELKLTDLTAQWLAKVKPEIDKLKGTDFYKTHEIYDEAVVRAETKDISKLWAGLCTQVAKARAEGSSVSFEIHFKNPEDLPFEPEALKNLPTSDLVTIEITAPTKAKLLKVEETLKKQGLLPAPVTVIFKTPESESTWLPDDAVKPVPRIGFVPMMSGKSN